MAFLNSNAQCLLFEYVEPRTSFVLRPLLISVTDIFEILFSDRQHLKVLSIHTESCKFWCLAARNYSIKFSKAIGEAANHSVQSKSCFKFRPMTGSLRSFKSHRSVMECVAHSTEWTTIYSRSLSWYPFILVIEHHALTCRISSPTPRPSK